MQIKNAGVCWVSNDLEEVPWPVWRSPGATVQHYKYFSLCRPAESWIGYCQMQIKHYKQTLVDLQLDAQNSCLFTYNTFINILYMFRALPCSSSGGLRRNCIYAAYSIVTLCRWLSCAPVKKEFFLNRCTRQSPAENSFLTGAQDSHLQRLHIYSYDVDLLKMSRVMLETCRGY